MGKTLVALRVRRCKVKSTSKQFHCSEKGFTLIELLVVIAIVGFLTAVAVLNYGQFVNKSRAESHEVELKNVQTAVKAMLAYNKENRLDAAVEPTDDMTEVTVGDGVYSLDEYLTGLDASGKIKSGCTYTFAIDGIVTQITP